MGAQLTECDWMAYWRKLKSNSYRNIPSKHTVEGLNYLKEQPKWTNGPLLIDAGCGTGKSTFLLADRYQKHFLVGVDQSQKRLNKSEGEKCGQDRLVIDNKCWIRADLVSLYQLLYQEKLIIDQHFIFYPNPWPKKKQFKRRWHGHPIFPTLLNISRNLVMRTNWQVYANEFKQGCLFFGKKNVYLKKITDIKEPISLHEKKYYLSGHQLFEVGFSI